MKTAHINGLYGISGALTAGLVAGLVAWLANRGSELQPLVSEVTAIPQQVNDKGDELDENGNIVPDSLRLPVSAKSDLTLFDVTVFNPTDRPLRLRHGTFTPLSRQTRWYASVAVQRFPMDYRGDEIVVPVDQSAESEPRSFSIHISIPPMQSRRFAIRFRVAPPAPPSLADRPGAERLSDPAWIQRIVGELEFPHEGRVISAGSITLVAHSEMPTWEEIRRLEGTQPLNVAP